VLEQLKQQFGSANFPEDELLAEVYVLALQAKGVKVTPKFNIGAREVYYPQIAKGAISIIPEYNGALLSTSVDTTSTAKTTAQVDAALTAKLPSTLEILSPASATDSDSVTVTQAFTFKSFDPLDESGPLTLAALQDGKVQAADVFTTTPQIISDKLVSLTDPKFNFAAQNIIPLVYKPAMNATIIGVLNAISAKLTTAALLQMDNAIITDKANYSTVAAGFLKAEGLS
jgi:osmoprotectant transport system substrate-binding protein